MKTKLLLAWLVGALVFASNPAFAASSSAKAELQVVVDKIKDKIKQGQSTETALAPELAEFDALIAKHRGEKTDEVAQIYIMKASLYAQVFKDDAKAIALFEQLKTEFAGTPAAGRADAMIASVKQGQEANKIQNSLAVGAPFPGFAEKSLAGSPLALADYKGKIVLIDFWATWCGPCVAELPNVVSAYRKHHAAGFDIIGISLDRADARQKLVDFTKSHEMPWAQIYDGNYWQSKLAVQYGVNSIPATYLLDGDGRIVAKNLRGPALEKEIARLLAKR